MNNIFEREIDGVLYKAEFKGIAFANELRERGNDNNSHLELGKILFEEVLISPKIDIDDFADMATFIKVYNFLLDVARGTVKKIPSEAKLTRKVKQEWGLWALVLSEGGFDFSTVFGKPYMSPQDVKEANIALKIKREAEKKAAKRKR